MPNAEALSGRTKVELVLTLARAFSDQGEAERWHSLSRRAVDMLEPSTDPLVASRAYAALGVSAMHDHDMPSAPEAIERAIAYAGSAPTEEGAYALAAHALLLNFNGHYAAGLDAADRAIQAARATASTDPLFWALRFRSEALYYLGYTREAAVVAEQGVEEARKAGMTGQALHASGWLAAMLMDQGQVDRGKTIASAAYAEAVSAGLPFEAGWCGQPVAGALTWEGRLDAAEQLLEEICALSPPDAPWRGQAEVFLARGDADMAAQVMPAAALSDLAVARTRMRPMSCGSSSWPPCATMGSDAMRWPRHTWATRGWRLSPARRGRRPNRLPCPRAEPVGDRTSGRPPTGHGDAPAGSGSRRPHRRMAQHLPRGPARARRRVCRQVRR